MKNILEYKGYLTKIEYSVEDKVIFGKIEGIKDLILFESDKTEDIENKFQEAVDEYLDFCKNVNKIPDKQFSGSFNVRINSDLHKNLALYGIRNNQSLNSVVENALSNFMKYKNLVTYNENSLFIDILNQNQNNWNKFESRESTFTANFLCQEGGFIQW